MGMQKLIVMYNGKGKTYITNIIEGIISGGCPLYVLYEDIKKKEREVLKNDLAMGIPHILHSQETDIKKIKKMLGVGLTRRSIFVDMSYNK